MCHLNEWLPRLTVKTCLAWPLIQKSWLQTAAQTDKQHALAKLTELEGVLQQALDQRTQATEEVSNVQTQLKTKHTELLVAQQQLQQQQQKIAILQVIIASQPYMSCSALEERVIVAMHSLIKQQYCKASAADVSACGTSNAHNNLHVKLLLSAK